MWLVMEKMEAFESVREVFVKLIPVSYLMIHEIPSATSVMERYPRLDDRRRETVRLWAAASDIVEDVLPLDQLLEDIILEKDEFEEQVRFKRAETNAREA